ncbi:unnamed protein product [Urochloa decumbens]|uniref:Uncharacterized protein n=1 Tax=Urochloa decumbens TaxID=240449 RepID=A0ABC8ZSK8_9POAL
MASVQHSVVVDYNNNNNGDVAVQIIEQHPNESLPAPPEEAPITSGNRARLLFVLGFMTVLMDLATLLYKAPRGVWFETRRLAYYITLAGIFAAGSAEIIVAFWMCPSSHVTSSGWRRALENVVLLASIVPFVAVIALGGFTVLVKI